jgi:glycosyltransferase involved in cell wall biosynthesis
MLKTSPLVSILIPCYNAELYIAAAVQSALDQTWPNKEIIVVDDGSTDESGKLAEKFSRRGVRVLHQENTGQCAAANRAYRESSGEYIKFFDADDLLEPRTIELQMDRLAGNQKSIASAEWGRFYNDDLSTFCSNPQSVWRDMNALDWLIESWMDAQPMMQCALWLIPRSVLEHSGLWDERLSLINDFEFFARVLCHCEEVRFTPGARLYYRSGIKGSLSGRKSRIAVESAYCSLMTGTSHLLSKRQDRMAKLACANVLQDFIYTYYPEHPDLRSQVQTRVRELGGSNLPPSGPPRFKQLSKVMGWKLARRLQRLK